MDFRLRERLKMLKFNPISSSDVVSHYMHVLCFSVGVKQPGSPLTSSLAEHLWHPRSVNELKAMERRDWRGYHTLHVPDAAVLGTVNGGKGSGCYGTLCIPELAVLKGRSYHTCSQLCLPGKKAKIELAVDTVKEKKKAAPKVGELD